MTTNVIMPVLGMVQDSGKIVRWLKALGETVSQGEILMEVETDKAVQELESPASGILAQILAQEGDEVPVTQVVAVIQTPEEYRSTAVAKETSRVQPASSAIEVNAAEPAPQGTPSASSEAIRITGMPDRILASPKARRLARETHQALAGIPGSGPDGAVLAQDVEKWAAKAVEPPSPSFSAPPFYLHYSARAAHLLDWLTVLQRTQPEITLTDLLVFIASRALARHPKVNAIWQENKFTSRNEINIGLAVAVKDGMATPVIQHAHRLNPGEIARERARLVTEAQSGVLRPEDLSGGTFTLNEVGSYKIDAFDAVLDGSQTGALAVGRITEGMVRVNGAPVFQPVLNLSAAFDPRAVNTHNASKFLESLAEMIEEPLMLLA